MPKRSTARRHGSAAAPPRLPTREEILAFIENAGEKVGKREIARAFHIRGEQRRALKALLAEMADEGLLVGNRKSVRKSGELPSVTLLDAVAVDGDGTLLAEPVAWDPEEGPRPRVAIRVPAARPAQGRRGPDRAPGVGDRILTRIARHDSDTASASVPYRGEIIKVLPREGRRLLGIFQAHDRGGGMISPVDRKSPRDWNVPPGDEGDAGEGDLVRFEIVRRGRNGLPQARVLEALGNPDTQSQVSLIAIHAHGLSDEFPDAALAELERLPVLSANGRTDLRDLPLVTIDPADARDHDDAVHAEADPDPANNGGWIVTVAIADVAHYVRSGTGLDREAQKRGNSVYFPDRVVPMLPEAISNDLCSLREGEDRPCLAVRMVFDSGGTKVRHDFVRGLMRSARKLSYEQAQAVFDKRPPDDLEPSHGTALNGLWRAYQALAAARDRRQPLELELPERKLVLDRNGDVERVITPQRLDAHKLIEEFMIQANVAAAETLERRRCPLIYRSHDQPSRDKLKALREFFETLDLRLPHQTSVRPVAFNGILDATRNLPVHDLVNEVILRAQAQAEYSHENYGHFGLNLRRYAHFTSPIRRYADLLVHRALIKALGFGDDGLTEAETAQLGHIAEHISKTERQAMAAERETTDRLIAAHLVDRVGAEFSGRISGVTRSGLFVRLTETGADGFVPAASLHDDYYHFVEDQHALVGERNNQAYRLGDQVDVRLAEALPIAGALRFEMLSPGTRGHVSLAKGWRGRRARGRPRRRR